MSSKFFNVVCIAGLVACVYMVTNGNRPCVSGGTASVETPRVEVSAMESKKVAADKFVTGFRLDLRDKDKDVLFKRVAERRAAIFANVAALDIPEKNVEQNSVDVRKEWSYHDGKRYLAGYVATQSFEVSVDNKSDAAALVAALASEPDVEIDRTSAELKDVSAVQSEIIGLASKKALSQAKSYADGVNAKLGDVIYVGGDGGVNVYGGYSMHRRAKGLAVNAMMMDGAAPDESAIADSVEVSASVRLIVELK